MFSLSSSSSTFVGRLATFVLLSSSSSSFCSSRLTFSRVFPLLVSAMSSSSSSSSSNLSNTTILNRLFSTNQHQLVTMHHLTEPVSSTQDAARRLLHTQQQKDKCLAVTAVEQLKGRGTQGRAWEGGDTNQKGNLYLTVCLPYDRIPVRITLLPLQIAALVADRVSRLIEACRTPYPPGNNKKDNDSTDDMPKTTVKWPNDVLVNDSKISGTLIENEIVEGTIWLLVGIGINVAYAPDLSNSPGMQLRGATHVKEHCAKNVALPENTASLLGTDLANALVEWTMDDTTDRTEKETKVIQDWKSFAEFGTVYQLRGEVQEEDAGRHDGEKVVTVDLHFDGQLRVRGQDGRERLLVADYMF